MSRELREHSRRSMTYYSRFGVGVVATGFFLFTLLMMGGVSDASFGLVVFGMLRRVLSLVILVVVPVLVCDTLSREKREGTLELLFLTPLRPGSVLMGKSLAQLVRVWLLVVVVAPVFSMVWLSGGVSGQEYLGFFLYTVSGLVLSFLSGLLASAMVRRWGWAVFWGLVFSMGSRWLHHGALGYFERLSWGVGGGQGGFGSPLYARPRLVRVWFSGEEVGFSGNWILVHGVMLLLAVVAAWLVLRLVAAGLRKGSGVSRGWGTWSRLAAWSTRPVVAKVRLQRRLGRALDSNPIGWLHQRRATTRITKWVWCLVVLVVQTYVLISVGWDEVGEWQWILGIVVGTGLMVSAAGSFRVEREDGAFELLLVTSITEAQIIWGRLRGLWAELFPSIVLLCGLSVAWWLGGGPQSQWYSANASTMSMLGALAALVGWVAVPVIGLRSSFQFRTFPLALAVSWVWAFVVPAVAYGVVLVSVALRTSRWGRAEDPYVAAMLAWMCTQLAVAGVHWVALHQGLVRREFRVGRTPGRWMS